MSDFSHQAPLAQPTADGKGAPATGDLEEAKARVPPIDELMLTDHHADFAGFHETYVRHNIALADTKAAWTFTIASGLLAYLIGQPAVRKSLLSPTWSLDYALLAISIFSLALSAFFAFRVVAPRFLSLSGENIVFFGTVASKASADIYVREVAQHGRSELTTARLRNCYDISKVCWNKYSSLKKSIWFGLPALPLSLLYLAMHGA